eukprot:14261399-Ditylum_brightwellii.AAC.1
MERQRCIDSDCGVWIGFRSGKKVSPGNRMDAAVTRTVELEVERKEDVYIDDSCCINEVIGVHVGCKRRGQ